MYNPQSDAVSIEHFLHKKGFALLGDADKIRNNPIGYLEGFLGIYENQSDRHDQRSAEFWDKYECYKGKRLDEIDKNTVNQLKSDIRALFNLDEE